MFMMPSSRKIAGVLLPTQSTAAYDRFALFCAGLRRRCAPRNDGSLSLRAEGSNRAEKGTEILPIER
jgi:hypothetical protein